MQLRFPTLSEILGLFFTSANVDAITASITRQVKALEDAVQHHCDKADCHASIAYDHEIAAETFHKKAKASLDEAVRAGRVAEKLKALTA